MPGIDRIARIGSRWLLIVTVALPVTAVAADKPDLDSSHLVTWLTAYGSAWENRDANAAANLFAADATYQVTPFETPHQGPAGVRAYWAEVTANQRNIDFRFTPLAALPDGGIAHWTATFEVVPAGDALKLDGIFVLEFDAAGKCRSLREWWHLNVTPASPSTTP